MDFTPEQLTKAKAAKSADELIAFAKAEGVSLTEEEAVKYFTDLHKEGELSDDELDNIAGGGCGDSAPKYHDGDQFHNSQNNNDYKINGEGCWNDTAGSYEYNILGTAYGPQGSYTFSTTKLESELDVLPRIWPQS